MTPLISVLIPCYNAATTICETLDSVFAQTWPTLEVIVIDDGSTDGSAGLITSTFGNRLQLVQQSNRGQTAALNAALRHASGDYIQYLDADDVIDPEKITTQMARLTAAPLSVTSAEWGRFYTTTDTTQFVSEPVHCDMDPLDWLATSRADGLGMMFPALWLIPIEIVKAAG